MTLRITLDSQTEQRLREQAQAAGQDVEQFVTTLVRQQAAIALPSAPKSFGEASAELHQILDEVYAEDTRAIPPGPTDVSRDAIYDDHD
jgi:hypothetical protein